MVDAELFSYIGDILAWAHGCINAFGSVHVLVFGDLLQLPPVLGRPVFHSPVWRLFRPLFLTEAQRQSNDLAFYTLLNKIRVGAIDEEVCSMLQARVDNFDISSCTYSTTFLCARRSTVDDMNELILDTLPGTDDLSHCFEAIDRENGNLLEPGHDSHIIKRGTIYPTITTCVVGARVMLLTNLMMNQGLLNGSCGVITKLQPDLLPTVSFPVGDSIIASIVIWITLKK